MKVQEYLTADGSSPFKKWFESLAPEAGARVTVALYRLEQGAVSSIKWFDGIGEYRIDWGPGIRIYLAQDGDDLIILLGGGTKKRQDKDIELAKACSQDYKKRKPKQIPSEKQPKKR